MLAEPINMSMDSPIESPPIELSVDKPVDKPYIPQNSAQFCCAFDDAWNRMLALRQSNSRPRSHVFRGFETPKKTYKQLKYLK